MTPLVLTSICRIPDGGLRWRVHNTNAEAVEATYEVVDTADTGVVAIAAAGNGVIKFPGATDGLDYTFFDTEESTSAGTTKLIYDDGTGTLVTLTKAANNEECPPDTLMAPLTICKYDDMTDELLGGWEIVITNDDVTYTHTTVEGECIETEIDAMAGRWQVYEIPQAGWELMEVNGRGPGANAPDYYAPTDDDVEFTSCWFDRLEPGHEELEDQELSWHCEFYNLEVKPVSVTACKVDEFENAISGWEMIVYTDDGSMITQETGSDGCAYIEVMSNELPVTVEEEVREGWEQVDISAVGGYVATSLLDGMSKCVLGERGEGPDYYEYASEVSLDISLSTEFAEEAHFLKKPTVVDDYRCVFMNSGEDIESESETPSRSGGGYEPRNRSAEPTPQVLGVATTTVETTDSPSTCGMYLNDYLRMGQENDAWEVMKLQIFLTAQGMFTPMTGILA